ncbi:glycosyltransferase family 2 protein [Streptomyces sp. NPDC096142]|uniref:glycosyltransferase family 2 protein n=1 Tax=Streptomyces sp. NPDC096142 TaxID=3366077 RepID=UPI00381B26A9
MSGPGISVVICVYTEDRWEDILAAVSSVRAQSRPALETLLVVDHNPALLDRLTREYKDAGETGEVRVLANAGPRGLSAGRNTGIAASRGEVVAFLDDDAVAEREWLRHFAEAYTDPRVMAVGGRTMPVWASGRRPAWFPEEFDWVVGCTYRGLPPGRVRVRNVLGGNASFRRTAFDAAGGFATGIGRDGDRRPLGGEETELCIRLTRARPDAVLLIDDRAVIHHRVPAVRERFGYFRARTYAEGLSKALVARSVGADKGLESERRYTTRVLPAGVLRGLRDAVLARPGGAGRAGAIVAGVFGAAGGYLVGSARARRGGVTFSVVRISEEAHERGNADDRGGGHEHGADMSTGSRHE